MSWRFQPPVYSPVGGRVICDGVAAMAGLRHVNKRTIESTLARKFGARDTLLIDSGTSALVLALQLLVPRDGIVALPAYGCIDLTAAVVKAGVRARLYDIEPCTLSPDLDSVRAVFERGVDAIIVAHFYGYAADVAAVRTLAQAHGVPLIEDAAQAAGGALRDQPLGGFGDLIVLSFGRGKGLTTSSGGALLARTQALARQLDEVRSSLPRPSREAHDVFTLGAQWLFARPSVYRLPASIPALKLGEMVYREPRMPVPMGATATAILAAAMRSAASELDARRARATLITAVLAERPTFTAVQPIDRSVPGFLRLAALHPGHARSLDAALGAVRGYPLTLDEHGPLQSSLLPRERAASGALELRDRLFTLPTHARVMLRDVERIAAWLDDEERRGTA